MFNYKHNEIEHIFLQEMSENSINNFIKTFQRIISVGKSWRCLEIVVY